MMSPKEQADIRRKLRILSHGRESSKDDKAFLLSVKNVTPDWSIYDFERIPAVRWKLQNLQNPKNKKPDKHRELYEALEKKLKEFKRS